MKIPGHLNVFGMFLELRKNMRVAGMSMITKNTIDI
jgi:hypothetical protein